MSIDRRGRWRALGSAVALSMCSLSTLGRHAEAAEPGFTTVPLPGGPVLNLSTTVTLGSLNTWLRSQIPDSISIDPVAINNDLVRAVLSAVSITDIGRLHDFQLEGTVSSLRGVELRNEGGRLYAQGTIRGSARVTANKEHMRRATCHERIDLLIGSKNVPYPCIETSYSRVDVASASIQVDLKLGVSLTATHLPATLADLRLQVTVDCAGLNIHGVQNDLERLLHPAMCGQIRKALNRESPLAQLFPASQDVAINVIRLSVAPVGDTLQLQISFVPAFAGVDLR